MRQLSRWEAQVQANPQHSHWYVQRFRQMAADGADLAGEARMVDAMLPRGSRVLDAGCGPGRVGAELAARGHTVVGVDVDPVLIDAARTDHADPGGAAGHGDSADPTGSADAAGSTTAGAPSRPAPQWIVGDLAELDLPAAGIPEPFDVIVSAGNVMTFLADGTQVEVLHRFRTHLAGDGRAVVGFGAGRGYAFDSFFADVETAGLQVDVRFSTWDLRSFEPTSDFLVAVLSRA